MSQPYRPDQRTWAARQPSGDRLGRALRDTVESQGHRPAGPLASAEAGSRAFAAALESRPARPRASAERPRFGVIVLMAVLGAAGAAAVALWPAITNREASGGSHGASVGGVQHDAGQPTVTPAATQAPAPAAAPAAAGRSGYGVPVTHSLTRPAPAGATAPSSASSPPAPPAAGAGPARG